MKIMLKTKYSLLQNYLLFIIIIIASSGICPAHEFTMEQTLSDQAQGTTIAFDGLAFITGSLGADSFFPPGKVADFWGFQYLRDNDPSRMGHNTDFLTRASLNMLTVLTPGQRQQLIALANSQVDLINEYGYNRFVLMKAFRRLLEGNIPSGTTGLGRNAVKEYSSELYQLDGRISFQRAHVMGTILRILNTTQKAYLDSMVGKGMLTWPVVGEPPELQGINNDVKVAVMTYAGDMFSWYAGSVEADVYFCPERQGTYFGSFYMKDAPAVGNPNYSIDTNLTAAYGRKFLEVLTPAESLLISGLVDIQRPYLYEIVDRREEISILLRKFMIGESPDSALVLGLMGRYGELDGEIVYHLATNFAAVNGMINSIQRDTLMAYRRVVLGDFLYPTGAYLYASPIAIPDIPNTDFLFTKTHAATYPIVGTGQTKCYNDSVEITPPESGQPYYGQDAQYLGNLPAYRDNGNGTITDLNTGLTWQRSPDQNGNNNGTIEKADKLTWTQIQARVSLLNSTHWGGYNDWRIPTIKELYSLTNWNGTDPSGYPGTSTAGLTPFIDNRYFPFAWGQTSAGERLIDVQYASCNMYNELTYQGYQKLFGFNFADGRIKGYDLRMPDGSDKVFSFIAVRGNTAYGINDFVDNGDQTITDSATGLIWSKNDSQTPMDWEQALAWVQTKNAANYCGHNDWRLPNAKELQSIVDYTRSPGSTSSAAINPIFNCTSITNEAGYLDWPWFWTSTTHRSYDGTSYRGANGIYVCFGRAAGWVKKIGNSHYSYYDAHGAGAQRSSPKSGTYYGDYLGVDSLGHPVYALGPQGDILRVNNYVRLVRDLMTTPHAFGSVEGTIFYDENQNGVQDIGERGIGGWKLHLYGTPSDSAVTNGNGFYSFNRLDSGSYHLRVESRHGWNQTYPALSETTLSVANNLLTENFGMYSLSVKFYNVRKGWNMVSMPQRGDDSTRSQLFPTAVSTAYAYDSHYYGCETPTTGNGYWLKFAYDQSVYLLGEVTISDTIDLHEGWNLIGSLGVPFAVEDIVSDSPGVTLSGFFGYEGSYATVDSLKPCRAYWVKSGLSCQIILNPGGGGNTFYKVNIFNDGEKPPAPPDMVDVHSGDTPNSFELMQNYPNPFNPNTVIIFQLPLESKVTLKVYNLLGQVVAVLKDGLETAGVRSIRWNATEVASGIYFYRLEAVSNIDPNKMFTQVKKMMVVK